MEQPSKSVLQKFFHTKNLPNTHDKIMKFATEYLMKKHYFDEKYDINTGWCFQWAYFVWCLHPNPEIIEFHRFGAYGHVVIKFQDKYYDCVTTKGTKSLRKFSEVYGYHVQHDNIVDVCEFWLDIGNSNQEFLRILHVLNPEQKFEIPCDDSNERDDWDW